MEKGQGVVKDAVWDLLQDMDRDSDSGAVSNRDRGEVKDAG